MPLDRILLEASDVFATNLADMLPCGFDLLYRMMLVCKKSRDLVLSAKQLWIRCARLSTGYADLSIDPMDPDFFARIRLVIFPWESNPCVLHFRIPQLTFATIKRRLALLGNDELAFVSEMEDSPSEVIGFPSRPCATEDFVPHPAPRPAWTDASAPSPGARRILHGGVIPCFVFGGFVYHRIHDGAFAIAAFFPRHSNERVCNGVYFFVERPGYGPVFHSHHSGPEFNGMVHFSSLCSRPGEVWIATSDRLIYFGPHSHPSCRPCDTFVSWDDEVFWNVYFGRRVTNLYHTVNARGPILQRTAVHYAVYGCSASTLKEVLDARADPNLCDICGISPLQIATQMCFNQGIEMLVRAGATRIQGMLHYIGSIDTNVGREMTARTLLSLGADPNAADRNGYSPLHKSHFLSDGRLLQLLCSSGADPKKCDTGDLGLSPLHWAVCYRLQSACVSLVREYGCDVNCVSARYGITPLMSAVSRDWYEGVRVLVEELGADIHLRDVAGLRAVDMARTERIVRFLARGD